MALIETLLAERSIRPAGSALARGADALDAGSSGATVHVSLPHVRDIYLASHSSVYGVGGGVTVTEQLAAVFEQRGHHSLVLGIGENAVSGEELNASVKRLNLRVSAPGRLWRLRNWVMPRRLARALSELPPPRVAFVGVNPLWVIAAKRAWPDVPVVFLFVALLSNCQPFTWPRRRPNFWQRIDYAAIRRADHLALSLADRIIAPTRQARDELESFHPASRGCIDACTYGCEARNASALARAKMRAELGLSADTLLILAVGVCNRNKGFELAIREMPAVDACGQLVVIGDGPERENLIRLSHELGVSERVRLIGQQPDLDAWYAAADCVLSTSRYDTFPYVILDGMSLGRPAVVPRHAPPDVYSGISEVITDHGGGVLYDRERGGALAECLSGLARDSRSRALLGSQARQFASRRLNWNACADLILGGVPAQLAGVPGSTYEPVQDPEALLAGSSAAQSEGL
jgi:glycosyltransferase involved in cell wall biosynthesis